MHESVKACHVAAEIPVKKSHKTGKRLGGGLHEPQSSMNNHFYPRLCSVPHSKEYSRDGRKECPPETWTIQEASQKVTLSLQRYRECIRNRVPYREELGK
jgi:hypothetical protein